MKKILLNRDFILFSIILIILIAVGFANPLFVTPKSISDVLTDTSILIIHFGYINVPSIVIDLP